jgi:hypothetical protein
MARTAVGACAGPRAFPKGTLHLIPEPEEKASELLHDLIANDSHNFSQGRPAAYSVWQIFGADE